MLDIAAELHRWCGLGRPFAVATVVAVGGSAPRRPGAALAVDAAGTAVGSVSGGCVEGAVYELCQEVLRTGDSVRERFGYSADDAFAVGLTCGGEIEVVVRRVDPAAGPEPAGALAAAAAGEAVALARVIGGGTGPDGGGALAVRGDGTVSGGLGDAEQDRLVAGEAAAWLAAGRTGIIELGEGTAAGCRTEPLTVFVESSVPPPRMLVYGAIDFAAALARIGAFLGYRVTVCDARAVFATPARFPDAAEVVVDWPHRHLDAIAGGLDARTVICVLTHDAKFDIPLLRRALELPVGYVGAMGSRRTHAERLRRLRDAGAGEEALARLRSPIGLDLGAHTPEETALSIAAEIVAARTGGSGAPLTGVEGPIHAASAVPHS